MKIRIVSLRKLPSFSESHSGIATFWKHHKTPESQGSAYQPVWQSIEWGKMLIASGQAEDAVYFGVYRDTKLLAYGIGEVRTIGLGYSAMFFVGGPQFLPNEIEAQSVLMREIMKHVRNESLVFALFENIFPFKYKALRLFVSQTKYLLEPTTRLIDLTQTTDEILADMKQKGRYNIKLAEKWGCEAQHVPVNSANIDIFYSLLQDTTDRDGFSANKKSYYEHLLGSRKDEHEGLYFVYFWEKVIAAAILIISGTTAIYYYGASSSDSEYRKLMAPYALQWEMIRQSKKCGCIWYDFLGIAPEGEMHHHLQWVTDFKSKFWGFIHTYPQKQLFIARNVAFCIYRVVRFLKWAFSSR